MDNKYRGVHLFVLVHGFQGSSYDVRMFKNIINIVMPDAQFLCSSANEENSDHNIFEMGNKLAIEIAQRLDEGYFENATAMLSMQWVVLNRDKLRKAG